MLFVIIKRAVEKKIEEDHKQFSGASTEQKKRKNRKTD